MSNGYYIKVEPVVGFNGLELVITVSDSDLDNVIGRTKEKTITLTESVRFSRCGYFRTPFGATELRMKRRCERVINQLTDKITMIKRLGHTLTRKDGVSRATRRLEK